MGFGNTLTTQYATFAVFPRRLHSHLFLPQPWYDSCSLIADQLVFLIQNTQKRDALAMQLKLDEIIRAIEGADNAFIRAEEATTEELEELKLRFEALYAAHTELKSNLTLKMAQGITEEHE